MKHLFKALGEMPTLYNLAEANNMAEVQSDFYCVGKSVFDHCKLGGYPFVDVTVISQSV